MTTQPTFIHPQDAPGRIRIDQYAFYDNVPAARAYVQKLLRSALSGLCGSCWDDRSKDAARGYLGALRQFTATV
jgi:hypothetical protein